MKIILTLTILFIFTTAMLPADFLTTQIFNERVISAYKFKKPLIQKTLQANKLDSNTFQVVLIAYKSEQILEIHATDSKSQQFKKIATFNICNSSGNLGPKYEEGDFQVPEGFYIINKFNPLSKFHLSLGINYPNEADLLRTTAKNPGGEIYIHGGCVTVGCLPMTDDLIKEIYLYCAIARYNGQAEIPVYIFPFKMVENNFISFIKQEPENYKFWKNLKTGYDMFYSNKKKLDVKINKEGTYTFSQ